MGLGVRPGGTQQKLRPNAPLQHTLGSIQSLLYLQNKSLFWLRLKMGINKRIKLMRIHLLSVYFLSLDISW